MEARISSVAFTVVVGALVVVLLLLLPRLLRGSRRGHGNLLIMGPSGAGKTSLFVRLRQSKPRDTVTSMVPNKGVVSAGDGERRTRVHAVDLPGHPRLAFTYFQQEVVSCKGVIVVVDAMNFNATKEELARQLYGLLTSPVIRGRGVPILVVCNKSDGGSRAHTCDFIRKRTEKLIQQLYDADVGDSMRDPDAREHNILSGDGSTFTFEQLRVKRRFHRPLDVSFESVSVREGDNMDVVTDFIVQHFQ